MTNGKKRYPKPPPSRWHETRRKRFARLTGMDDDAVPAGGSTVDDEPAPEEAVEGMKKSEDPRVDDYRTIAMVGDVKGLANELMEKWVVPMSEDLKALGTIKRASWKDVLDSVRTIRNWVNKKEADLMKRIEVLEAKLEVLVRGTVEKTIVYDPSSGRPAKVVETRTLPK